MTDQLIKLRISQLRSHPQNIRRYYNQGGIRELADSILAHGGLIQPMVVTPNPDEAGTYLVIVGNRRYRAGVLLGDACPLMDARVEGDIAKVDQLLMMVSENLQREDPDPISEALHYQLLMRQEKLSISEIAHRTGVSHPRVSGTLFLLELPVEIQQLVGEGRLQRDVRVARALLSIPDRETQIKLAQRFADDGATTAAILKVCDKVVEKMGRRADPLRKKGRPASNLNPAIDGQPMVRHAQAKGAAVPTAGAASWKRVRDAASSMCSACDAFTLELRAKQPEPAWEMLRRTADETCKACGLQEYEKVCAACPGVSFLRALIKTEAVKA
jgi:ParB/RepB/Spo0J family partition protein